MGIHLGTTDALSHLVKHRKTKTALHTVALASETVGTMFIFLDTLRVEAQLHAAGFASYGGEPPPSYQHWYYGQAILGFGLLLFGILFQGYLIYFEHRELQRASEAISANESD